MNNIYIYGASGHGMVVLDIALHLNLVIAGFVDRNPLLNTFEGYEVIRSVPSKANYIIAIGDNSTRQKIAETNSNNLLPALIHKHAIIGLNVKLGQGTVVAASVVINPSVIVKSHCIINTAAVIEHDCVIKTLFMYLLTLLYVVLLLSGREHMWEQVLSLYQVLK